MSRTTKTIACNILHDILEIELEAIESGTARIRQALADATVEVRDHRAMVKRLEELALSLEHDRHPDQRKLGVELRNRINGE